MKIDKVEATIERYGMLSKGDRVTVGFSGGADSVCLMHILCALREKYDIELSACHVNHMLRGEEADRDQQFCEDFCRRYNVKLNTLRADIAAEAAQAGESVELYARKLRYAFFSECADKTGKIATAHSLSDSMETAILNMIRGTALKGLCGIPETRDKIIRPLIECTRAEIEEYCKDNNLDYVTDRTNLTDEYTRNRIRHKIIPLIREENPGFYKNYLSMHKALSNDEAFLEECAKKAADAAKLINGYDAVFLAKQHDSILWRVVALLFAEAKVSVDSVKLSLVCSAVRSGFGKVSLGTGVYASVKNGILTVAEEVVQEYFEYRINVGDSLTVLNRKNVSLTPVNEKIFANSKKINQNVLKNYIDCDKIGSELVLRQRKDGDFVKLAANRMTKSLKKLFNEHKIPVEERGKVLILSDESGIVWVEGFGTAQRCAVDDNTERAVIIDVCPEKDVIS